MNGYEIFHKDFKCLSSAIQQGDSDDKISRINNKIRL